ncbi:MAG: hypothetical protein K8I04_01720 [Gammaproteobacteria bacterium]|nr:hypothetical protein [Gammaproteobacteria bacterium]
MAVKTENRTAERVTIRLSLSERRALDRVPGEARADQVRNAIAAYESVALIDEKIERLRAEQNRIAEQIDARLDAILAQIESRILSNLGAKIEKMGGKISVIHAHIEGVKAARKKADEKKAAEVAEREKQNQAKPATDANSLFHRWRWS